MTMARSRRFAITRKRFFVGLLTVLLLILVGSGVWFWQAMTPPQPGAFYLLPETLPAGARGTIIRSERITSNIPEGAVGGCIMYLSSGLDGEPVAVTGVVVAPAEPSETPRPAIGFAQGTVGVLPACGTSHLANPIQFIPGVELLVQQGYVVAATDYPGRGTPGFHPYLVGTVEAYSVLDSVRAAQQLDVGAGDHFALYGRS
jgi:hypothetical protein